MFLRLSVCLSTFTPSAVTLQLPQSLALPFSPAPQPALSLLRAFGSLSSMHFLKTVCWWSILADQQPIGGGGGARWSPPESDSGSKDGSNYSGSGPKSTKKHRRLHRIQQFIHQTSARNIAELHNIQTDRNASWWMAVNTLLDISVY